MDIDTMFDDDDDQKTDDKESNPLKAARDHIKSLEKQLKQATKEAAEFREFKEKVESEQRQSKLAETFKSVGLNEKWTALYAKATDGEADPDAIKAFAEEYDLPLSNPEEGDAPVREESRSTGFTPNSGAGVPTGRRRYTTVELEALRLENPAEAAAVVREGRVDTVKTIAEDLARVNAEKTSA